MDNAIIEGLIRLLCFVPAIVVHEVAHGFVANRLGDPTAKNAGRLSLNPLKHIDVFGTVILPLLLAFTTGVVFGYAKPVPYNPRYFKNIKVGEVLTALAGPISNLLMAIVGVLVGYIFFAFNSWPLGELNYWIFYAFASFVLINLVLMFFNLLPIPPLDGSSLIVPFLPRSALPTWYKIQQYAMPLFMVVIFVLPYVLRFSPLSIYLNATAANLAYWLISFWPL